MCLEKHQTELINAKKNAPISPSTYPLEHKSSRKNNILNYVLIKQTQFQPNLSQWSLSIVIFRAVPD